MSVDEHVGQPRSRAVDWVTTVATAALLIVFLAVVGFGLLWLVLQLVIAALEALTPSS